MALAGTPAAAADGWTFAVSPYAWLPGITTSTETRRGPVRTEMSTGDVISDLDFAFMGAAEARNGRWGLIVDFIYSDLTSDASTPFGALWSEAQVETRLSATTVYAGYRVLQDEKGSLDVLAGGRFYSLDLALSLKPGRLPGRSASYDDDWADPVFGLRGRYDFDGKWFTTVVADAGGFSGGSDSTWQAFGSVGYQFNDRWSAQGGWRYLDISREIDGKDVSIELSGPLVGLTYRF
ncbi:MAG: hypothetical protein DI556_07965 [Rhodovulum sulfidophilum]|uniref:Outer membrane protein beta-barrel domain-containing protein n=1 Tax=Rhodovulum sulfidophilum TaxID=35806 RepID=A0A2W5NAI5_RHOSU|nr:MAG: hypothetical protein DI556_07965 [Rhodovulum sulfidophilum]